MTDPDPVSGRASERDLQIRRLTAAVAELEAALAETRTDQAGYRRFLADAAHQLRTPLAGILACAEALVRGQVGEEGDRLFANLVRDTSRSVRLVADLRTLARLDDGEGLQPRQSDLVALCRDEISRVWSLAPQLDVVLRAPGLTWSVEVDERAVREILANVLDNARRHAHARIVVAIEPGEQSVDIRVADDGPGVAPEAVDTIFGRFVSLDGPGMQVAATVRTAAAALVAAASIQPDLVVIDLALTGQRGLRIVPELHEAAPGCAVVVSAPPEFIDLTLDAVAVGAITLVKTSDLRPLQCSVERLILIHGENCPSCAARERESYWRQN